MLRIKRGGAYRPPRVVLYGPPGIGKSTFGASAPAPIFVTTEQGVDNLSVDQTEVCRTWAELLANVKSVADEQHDYQTVVLDTLNGAADLASAHVCQVQFKGDWGERGFQSFGKGWAATSDEMRQLLPALDKCRERGMLVILIGHTGVVSVRNPLEGDYTKYAPELDRRVWARFSAWSDMILRAEFEHTIIDNGRGKCKAHSSESRILRCAGSVADDVKVRCGYELPDRLPLSWDAVAEHLGKRNGIGPKIKALWHLLAAEEQVKILAYLGISKLDDIDQARVERARSVLNKLQIRDNEQHAAESATKEG